MPFLSFRRIVDKYLLKISITYNEKQILLLRLLIINISGSSVSYILYTKRDSAFLLLKLLKIGLCIS